MIIDFDLDKSARNERERGLPFTVMEPFAWESAIVSEDNRLTYSERRFIALGKLGQRVHLVCLRANPQEVRRYENATHGSRR